MNAISTEGKPQEAVGNPAGFRWTYIISPAVVLLIAMVLAAVFYGRLPTEAAYQFSGGSSVRLLSRGAFLGWALGLQTVFFLLALGVTLLVTGAARRMQLAETSLTRTLFALIGNVVALPQIIFAYATLVVFLYNIYEISLPPLWIFALAVMLAGGIVLAVFFVRALGQSRRLQAKNISGSELDVG